MKTKNFIVLILFLLISSSTKTEKMKLYALYTPSHAVLKNEWFIPSIQDDFDLILEFHEQTCPSGYFMGSGWTKTTIKKVKLIIHAIEENWGKIFIFSDVDIQFFAPIQEHIEKLIENKDIIIQKNSPNGVFCSGFFSCRGNEKTLQLWQDALNLMANDQKISDQKALNRCLKKKNNKYGIVWGYLPNTFFGGGTLTGHRWRPGKKLPIPKNIVMHHANWTSSFKDKILQLRYVRNTVNARKNR